MLTKFAIFVAAMCLSSFAFACGERDYCDLPNGRYLVRAPEKWDGKSPLPTAVFFHGYRGSALETMENKDLGDALSRAGILLVAPDGLDGGWSASPLMGRGRDDVAFARDVVEDVARRFPVDRSLLIATGFSAGGFIVWRIACEGGPFAAYAPISGAFLDPIPETCPGGPVSLRHIHGTADATVPMGGRWIANGRIRQSDVRESIARLRAVDGCRAQPSRTRREGEFECETWSARDCASGREIALCLHPEGHTIRGRWLVETFGWARSLRPRAP
ncbi:MAG: hypothetical protein U1E28_07600 [Beijerinckiaceae bacterium]